MNIECQGDAMNDQTLQIDIEVNMGFLRVHKCQGVSIRELPAMLSEALAKWMHQHPDVQIIHVVPVSQNGNTVELHAWFEERTTGTDGQ